MRILRNQPGQPFAKQNPCVPQVRFKSNEIGLPLRIYGVDGGHALAEGIFELLALLFELAHPVTELDEPYGAEESHD